MNDTPSPLFPPASIDDYIAILTALSRPRHYLASIPTFTPMNLTDSFQFVDDGTTKTLYIYINGVWTAAGAGQGVRRGAQCVVIDFTSSVTVGDGKFYIHIDPRLAGMSIVDVHAKVITAGTTGTTDIQIANVTTTHDILSTKLTIDSGETGSETAATPAVINTSFKSVSLNDVLRIDVDAVSSTAPQGLIVTIGFN